MKSWGDHLNPRELFAREPHHAVDAEAGASRHIQRDEGAELPCPLLDFQRLHAGTAFKRHLMIELRGSNCLFYTVAFCH